MKKKILIIGAGVAGRMVADEIIKLLPSLKIAGFIDDDPDKSGNKYKDIPVLGSRADIATIVKKLEISEILIAIPSASANTIQSLIEKCEKTKVKIRIVPGISEIISGKVSLHQIREVKPEDLLGREKVNIDPKEVSEYMSGNIILVTGAGGSIGSEIVRQLSKYSPKKLILFDNNEFNLYHLDLELSNQNINYSLVLGDIRDKKKLDSVFKEHSPKVVFHAAAYKHVPLLETQIDEAIKTNIFGTKNIIDLSIKYKIMRFVFISTDKAVRPKSIMGMTKKFAEALCITSNGQHTEFTAVRFGNVLGSIGSVVPLFQEQIKKGGPITVTHPDIIRYFMTISEAAQLVIQAGCIESDGNLFILDMGEPVKIIDLAKQMIILSGFIPDSEIKIEITGLRPGEKLVEELLTDEENINTTRHKKIFISKPKYKNGAFLPEFIDRLNSSTSQEDMKLILKEFCNENTE